MSDKETALNAMRRVIDAVNSGENTSGLASMSDDIVIIDDVAPFHYSGRDAAEQWFRRLATTRNKLHASISLDSADVRVAGDKAYIVAPAQMKGSMHEEEFEVAGTVTSTLAVDDGTWLVNSLVWSSGR